MAPKPPILEQRRWKWRHGAARHPPLVLVLALSRWQSRYCREGGAARSCPAPAHRLRLQGELDARLPEQHQLSSPLEAPSPVWVSTGLPFLPCFLLL